MMIVQKLKSYLSLIRFSKQGATMLVLAPAISAILLAYQLMGEQNIEVDYMLLGLFVAGAFLMRSAGCVINDILDRKFDGEVTRTKERPIVAKKISILESIIILFVLLLGGGYVLLQLNMLTIIIGLFTAIAIFLYPLMKRITFWPQLFLGLVFNMGAIMGYTAVLNFIDIHIMILYCATMFWTIGYDTIYGYQDLEDDMKIGVKSTSILFKHNPKLFIAINYILMLILLFILGFMLEVEIMFFIIWSIIAVILIWQALTLNISDANNCLNRFKINIICAFLLMISFL